MAKGQGARIVYDCCDPYADYEGMAHGIHAAQRFSDIVSIADAITVPTETMRARVADQAASVPIVVVPDSIDYQEQVQSDLVPPTKSVAWFGNPGRGNLESGLWALKALKQRWNYAVTLITDPAKVEGVSDFSVEPWAYPDFIARLKPSWTGARLARPWRELQEREPLCRRPHQWHPGHLDGLGVDCRAAPAAQALPRCRSMTTGNWTAPSSY